MRTPQHLRERTSAMLEILETYSREEGDNAFSYVLAHGTVKEVIKAVDQESHVTSALDTARESVGYFARSIDDYELRKIADILLASEEPEKVKDRVTTILDAMLQEFDAVYKELLAWTLFANPSKAEVDRNYEMFYRLSHEVATIPAKITLVRNGETDIDRILEHTYESFKELVHYYPTNLRRVIRDEYYYNIPDIERLFGNQLLEELQEED